MRRADGQMVQLGPLMYALLDEIDGRRDNDELATAMCSRLGRACEPEHVTAIAGKLAEQGLLVGSEDNAPERINPLLALRWKVLITNERITDRITRPFVALFRPWILFPVLVAFLAVLWFVLIHKGVASATSQAFRSPELFLLVIGLAVASAAFHEIGHASACRYGGGRTGGMGAGIYMVWPAFYTDVTDAYRLPKRARLRTDLGGLFFNSVIAVVTLGAWLLTGADVLLLLIALQLLEMVKNLSPMIRSDGYHVLSDATGVPDLYAHMIPTLKSVLPGQRNQAGALTGRARVLVTAWVLIIVPVLLSMALSAILLLPKLAASTYESGSRIFSVLPDQVSGLDVAGAGASLVRLVALALPVLGSVLIVNRLVRGVGGKAWAWSAGHNERRLLVGAAGAAIACLLAWAWWPSGQYQPVRATDNGTILGLGRLVAAPASAVRPQAAAPAAAKPQLSPGKHLAVALIPQGGATKSRPAIFVIKGKDGEKPVVLVSSKSPPIGDTPQASQTTPTAAPTTTTTPSTGGAGTQTSPTPASVTAFDFKLPAKPGPNDSQALAVNRDDGKTKYTVAYSLVTVRGGDPVNERNGAYAFSNCTACKTVAVSFQLVLIVGTSKTITPINVAEALNGNCPSCVTTAIADQIVVTLKSEPSPELLAKLNDELKRLDAIKALGDSVTPAQVAQQVLDVQKSIDQDLKDSGLLTNPPPSTSTTSTTTTPTTTTSTTPADTTPTDTTPAQTTPTTTETTPAQTTPTQTTPATTTTQTTPTQTTTTP